jgi:acyl-CoA reductase-like NAD-dependent aldehyde dehydrogenase
MKPACRADASKGERARTVGQLRLFAKEVRDGNFQELRFDPADADRKPVAKPDLRLRNIALGPVAVFGASNFPLAFSVAGGDTASALAAGCPVVVKAHSAHPGTSALVGKAVADAVAARGLPSGTFALLFDAGFEVGQAFGRRPPDTRRRLHRLASWRHRADEDRIGAEAADTRLRRNEQYQSGHPLSERTEETGEPRSENRSHHR